VGAFSLKFSIAPSDKTIHRIKKKLRGGGCKDGMDLLYHHAKYGGDSAPDVDEKVWCWFFLVFTVRPAQSAAMPVLFLLGGPKTGFLPRRGDTLPRLTWNLHGGSGPTVRSSATNFTFIGAEMCEYSPQICQNFEFWPYICHSRSLVCIFFLNEIRMRLPLSKHLHCRRCISDGDGLPRVWPWVSIYQGFEQCCCRLVI